MGYTGRTMRVRDPQLLRHLRLAANLSQTAIAHRAGVTRGAVSHWEQGRNSGITRGRALVISKTLSVPVTLLFIEDTGHDNPPTTPRGRPPRRT